MQPLSTLPMVKIRVLRKDGTEKQYEGQVQIAERFVKISWELESKEMLIQVAEQTNSIYINWDDIKEVETLN